jgi:single-stranded DNA-binding protein
MVNANQNNYNVCTNWGLRCFEQKMIDKGVILKCSMSRKNKDTNEYSAPVYIDVVCFFDRCEIAQDDYAKSGINVDGQFGVGDYTNKAGEKVATMSIYATKVTKKS